MMVVRIAGWVWFMVLVLSVSPYALGARVLAAETYTWRDAEGRRHFSDKPPPDGVKHGSRALAPLWSPGREHPGTHPGNDPYLQAPELSAVDKTPKSTKKKNISAADYDLSPTILVSGRELSVRGRIDGGPECANLKLRFTLKNEHGRSLSVSTLVADAGGPFGSTIYVGTSLLKKSGYGRHWAVVDRQAVCE